MTSTDDVLLRPASPQDAEALATVHLEARKAAVPAMPPPVHSDDETRAWVRGWLAGDDEVWVAEVVGDAVGYARLTDRWLDDLYVVPELSGRGIGGVLLELAKSVRPGGFALWVFESNVGARRFYRRHGLVELERTDGSGNEERQPDVRMAWPGVDPLAFLRAQIDEVDDELALVLARRSALTAAIQRYKEVPGQAGRDPDREAEIAARMARHAPDLGEHGFRRIMHEVISTSLDAHARAVTLSAYDFDADRRAEDAPPLPSDLLRLLDDFVEALPAEPFVLEVGSASGRDAVALEERGVRVRRTDLTEAFVARLRTEGWDATRPDPLTDDLGGPYDGVYASAVLRHLSRPEMATVLRRLRAATREGGVLAVTLKEGVGSGALHEALAAAGWSVLRLDSLPSGRSSEQGWLHALATAG